VTAVADTARLPAAPRGRRRRLAPYLLLAPGLAWLIVFFVVPMYYLATTSLQKGSLELGYTFKWAWSNYGDAVTTYHTQFLRSLEYAGIATLISLLVSYPLAYWIAFRGRRWKNLFLLLVISPFFVTYLIRTLAWETILSDNGVVVKFLRDIHVLGSNGRLLATSAAVVAGITYNFLPFMVLPLYVSLEQVDVRLLDAAHDLYASRVWSFLRVTLPLSLPGVFAGTMLTFIPAAGDFVNAQLLGTPQQYMIGNVIQSKFLQLTDYPQAAALSFVLMAAIMAAVIVYVRLLGTERLTG
jgi:spermidine/putrescine transport system permease protein